MICWNFTELERHLKGWMIKWTLKCPLIYILPSDCAVCWQINYFFFVVNSFKKIVSCAKPVCALRNLLPCVWVLLSRSCKHLDLQFQPWFVHTMSCDFRLIARLYKFSSLLALEKLILKWDKSFCLFMNEYKYSCPRRYPLSVIPLAENVIHLFYS